MIKNFESGFETSIECLDEIDGELPPDDIYSISVNTTSAVNGYEYDYTFLFDNPTGQHITITSEEYVDCVQKNGSRVGYTEPVGDLARIGQHTRRLSGGQFDITSSFGAILGLRVDLDGPNVVRSVVDCNVRFSMAIHLEDTADVEPGLVSNRFATVTRLNQMNRESIEDPSRLKWWEREFITYNTEKIFGSYPVPKAMKLTGKSVASLINNLIEVEALDKENSTIVRLKSDLRV